MSQSNYGNSLAQLIQDQGSVIDQNDYSTMKKLEQSKTTVIQPFTVTKPADLSIVIPLLNEVDNLEILYRKLSQVLETLPNTYEIIFIDDGSTDGSFELLRTIQSKDDHVRIIRFRRNFGQTAAFSAGFDLAEGDVVITMDADLQNDPTDIPRLLAKLDEGYDVVSGWRVQRQESF